MSIVTGLMGRHEARSGSHSIRCWLRLLRIEARRSTGLLLFPMLVFAAWWVAREYLPNGVALWTATAYAAKQTVIFLGPLMAGLAAWTAGRNGRRGMDELLASTPRGAASRDLMTWAGVALWGMLAYAGTAAVLSAITYPRATWGSSPLVFLAEGLFALLAYTAIGYAVGYYLHSRFVAPLLPVALYVAQAAPAYTESSLQNLSPVDFSKTWPSVFYGPDLGIFLARAGWLLGLVAVAAVVVTLRTRRTPLSWLAMVATVTLTGVSASALLEAAPGAGTARILEPSVTEARALPYEPVCGVGRAMEVCAHPAYTALLPPAAEIVNRVVASLKEIPSAPTRAEQVPELESPPEGTIRLPLEGDLTSDEAAADKEVYFAQYVAGLLTTDERVRPQMVLRGPNDYGCVDEACERYYAENEGMAVQGVVAEWLWRQAGYRLPGMGTTEPEVQASPGLGEPSGDVKRFIELDPAKRREWLTENFAELRAGKLTLEDLP